MSELPALVHVVDTLEFGGLERVVTDLAIAQHARGQQVGVFSIDSTGGFRRVLEQAGVPVHIGGKRGAFDRQVLRRLRSVARHAELLHTHNFVPNYYAAMALLGMRGAPCLVHSVHNMGTRLSNRRLRWLYRASLQRTARMAAVGRQVRDHFVSSGYFPAQRTEVLHNGIRMDLAVDAGARDSARRALGIAADAPVLGCVGRLVPVKNHAGLLALLPALIAGHPQLQLLLIGDGPLRGELVQQAEELGVAAHVHLAGSRDDVPSVLPAMDVFVQPSHSEGLSIALLEACRAGLAIVASDVGGNREIIRNDDTGVLVPAGDGPALRRALEHLLADVPLRGRLGGAAAAWVCEHGSINAMRRAHDAFYERAIHC